MQQNAYIITDDARFARMLSIELTSIGVSIITSDEFDKTASKNKDIYVIADLDCVSYEKLEKYSKRASLVGFSRLSVYEVQDEASLCTVFLHRPFLITELLDIFNSNVEKTTHRSSQKKTKLSINFRRSILIDHTKKAVIWGDMMIPLSENEFKVFFELYENEGTSVSREKINSLLGADGGNMGDVYVCYLRRKIDNKLGLKLIYTVRGKGYMLKNPI